MYIFKNEGLSQVYLAYRVGPAKTQILVLVLKLVKS